MSEQYSLVGATWHEKKMGHLDSIRLQFLGLR